MSNDFTPHNFWRVPKFFDKFTCEFEVKQRKSKELGHAPWLATFWG
jgi:hypothetical protein